MANLISVTSFSSLDQEAKVSSATTVHVINVNRIVDVTTLTTPVNTTGVTSILYHLPVNNTSYVIQLIVTEARSVVLDAANAALA